MNDRITTTATKYAHIYSNSIHVTSAKSLLEKQIPNDMKKQKTSRKIREKKKCKAKQLQQH